MKFLMLILFFFAISVHADGKVFFSAKQIQSWDINQKTELYMSFIRFFRQQESESLYLHIDANNRVSFLKSLSHYLMAESHAGVQGKVCFFGGWKTDVVQSQYCGHPKQVSSSGYKQGGCFKGDFRCNPALFGNTCVEPRPGFKGLTESCWKKFNEFNLIKPFLANKTWNDFEQMQKDVDQFCGENKDGSDYTYDACSTLLKHLEDLKKNIGKSDEEHATVVQSTAVKDPENSGQDIKVVITQTEHIMEITETIIHQKKTPCPDKSCEEMNNCSESLLDRSKRTFSKGFMGTVLFQDTPQDKCAENVDISKINLSHLDEFIHQQPVFESPYAKFSKVGKKCLDALSDGHNKKAATLAKTYMLVDFYDKQARLANGSDELLKGLAEVNAMLGEPLSTEKFCNSLIKSVDQQCEQLKKCDTSKSNFIDEKVKNSQDALKQVIVLEEEAEKLRILALNRRNFAKAAERQNSKFKVANYREAKKARQSVLARIKELETSFPWIKDQEKNRAKLLASTEKMKESAQSFYKDHKKKLEKMYKDNERAYQCLFDAQSVNYSTDCQDIDLIVKRNPHLDYGPLKDQQKGAFDYYQCAESQRYMNEKQIDTVEDYAIMAGLSVVPFGLGHLGRAAIWGSRLLLAADTAYMGNVAKDEINSCREKEQEIQSSDASQQLHCQDFVSISERLQVGEGSENCLLAGVTPAALALIPYGGYALSRMGKVVRPVVKTKALVTTSTKSKAVVKVKPKQVLEGEYVPAKTGTTKLAKKEAQGQLKGPSRAPAIEYKKPLTLEYKKPLALPKPIFAQGQKFAQDEFMGILKKLGIDYRVYLKKNLSPKNRERLISEILKYEKITVRGQGNVSLRKKQKLKSLIKDYSSKVKQVQSDRERGFSTEWLKLLQGI